MRLKFVLNCTNSVKTGVVLLAVAFVLRDSLLFVVVAEKGFSQVAGWLTVQWSFVVTSWALADEWSESVAS